MPSPSRYCQHISPDVVLGKNVQLSEYINLYGCIIGDDTKIGPFVEVQKNVQIGKRCKIQSHSFICEGVIIKDMVFVGHGVIFINDKYPRATCTDGTLQTDADWNVIPTIVHQGASIGSNATIMCGVSIGRHAIIGAGSLVTRDVPERTIVSGNPAKYLRTIAEGL